MDKVSNQVMAVTDDVWFTSSL